MSPDYVRVTAGEYVARAHVARLFVQREALETCWTWAAYAELGNRTRVLLRRVEVDRPTDAETLAACGDAMRDWLDGFVRDLARPIDAIAQARAALDAEGRP